MMNYDDIIKTVSEIVNNDEIYKEGLILQYQMSDNNHKKMDEHLFYKANPDSKDFEHNDVIELEIGGITVRFIKEDLDN
jgi:hypothetical protein